MKERGIWFILLKYFVKKLFGNVIEMSKNEPEFFHIFLKALNNKKTWADRRDMISNGEK